MTIPKYIFQTENPMFREKPATLVSIAIKVKVKMEVRCTPKIRLHLHQEHQAQRQHHNFLIMESQLLLQGDRH